ncbi:Glycosyltransferase [Quillaja saponaria]|uniref:Glycosyltransferase n=1 Tax=Quillaja saponaria TaxID=32244 RepID=A0AAD7LGR7_QUISA|nr:Glycosyltransferase [Quillaja saponaria]
MKLWECDCNDRAASDRFCLGTCKQQSSIFWIVRPDVVMDESAILPPEFFNEIKDRIGMEVNHDVKREEIAAPVKEMVVGNNAKGMKKNALELKLILEDHLTMISIG